jgi:hypothetical protein
MKFLHAAVVVEKVHVDVDHKLNTMSFFLIALISSVPASEITLSK